MIPLKYYEARDFSNGLAAVQLEKDGKWGFIDTTGKVVIDFKFGEVGDFHQGRTWANNESIALGH